MSTADIKVNPPEGKSEEWVDVVRRHVEMLRYGVVQIVVHDSRVVQVEKTEKIRIDRPGDAGSDRGKQRQKQNETI